MTRTLPLPALVGLIYALAWAGLLPWAALTSPPEFLWVVFRAVGGALPAAIVGWAILWRTKGFHKAAVGVVLVDLMVTVGSLGSLTH
jgi:hypothetical protein